MKDNQLRYDTVIKGSKTNTHKIMTLPLSLSRGFLSKLLNSVPRQCSRIDMLHSLHIREAKNANPFFRAFTTRSAFSPSLFRVHRAKPIIKS